MSQDQITAARKEILQKLISSRDGNPELKAKIVDALCQADARLLRLITCRFCDGNLDSARKTIDACTDHKLTEYQCHCGAKGCIVFLMKGGFLN